jgi:pyruvate,water dikinase
MCRRRLPNPLKRWVFMRALRRAQRLAVNREEWKNQAVKLLTLLRRLLLAMGARFEHEGRLQQAEDIFFLEIGEVEPVATGRAPEGLHAMVRQRRVDYERNQTLSPPPVVVGRWGVGAAVPGDAKTPTECFQGIPVFPGLVAGPARVILRTDDHEQVLPGEILVAPFTDPAWTPYFVAAAAVVMGQGGILSHGSIVAREYGLPAVTNVGGATENIRSGDWIEVDGHLGRVRVLRRKR